MIRLLILSVAITLLFSCGNSKEKALSLEKKNKTNYKHLSSDSLDKYVMNKPEVFDCMVNAIYYKFKLSNEDIDTIKTHYFHDIVDYADLEVRVLSERQLRLREITKDSLGVKGFKLERYEKELDSLTQELNTYQKTIVGFILVHTFYIKPERDTQTMLFVLGKNCGYKEAIKVKSIKNLNPEDYVHSFRNF